METRRRCLTEVLVTSLVLTSLLLVTSSRAVRVEITSHQQAVKVYTGSTLEIVCEVTDIDDVAVKSGQLIWGRIVATIETITDDGVNYLIEDERGSQRVRSRLTITSVSYTDEANYFCTWRQTSQTTDYINVSVKGLPEIIGLELDGNPIAGQNLTITCTVEGKPLPKIEWSRPLTTVASSSSFPRHSIQNIVINNHRRASYLMLYNVTSQATGSYRCNADNTNGTDARTISVNLQPWAAISTSPVLAGNVTSDPIVTFLTRMTLYCTGYNIPNDYNLRIGWFFRAEGNQTFVPLYGNGHRLNITRMADAPLTNTYEYYYVTSRLSINVSVYDHGRYQCKVYESGSVVADVQRMLTVEDIPRITLIPDTVGVAVGDDVNVTCRVEARPPVTFFQWKKNYATPLSFTERQVDRYSVELTLHLQIRSQVDYYHIISCTAENIMGTSSVDLGIEEKDDCDDSVCIRAHEYCVDTGESYYCACRSGYYRDIGSGLCVAYPTPTPVPTTRRSSVSPVTPSPTTSTTTRGETTEEGSASDQGSNPVGLYVGVAAGVAVAVIVIVVVVFLFVRRRGQGSGRDGGDPKPLEEIPVTSTTSTTSTSNTPSSPPGPATTYFSNTVFSPLVNTHEYTPLQLDRSEFPRERLQLQERLGQGKFGTVLRAMALSLFTHGKWDIVAVKMHKETATDAEKSEFIRELTLLRSLPRHPNVVPFVGCCTLTEPLYIIMEYCANGDLLSYLRKRRPDRRMFPSNNDLTARDFFSFALHVARGMAHIADHKIVHRDVAARNVLLSDRNVCKVSDFGLARRVDDNNDVYEIVSRRPLPLRWMSPESLRDGVHTCQSDVWSFGILLWELVTLGASPYPGSTGKAVIDLVTSGTRPEIPPQCRGELADIMSSCWAMTPEARPTFDVIAFRFEKLLEQEGDYLQLDNIKEGIYSILEPSVSGERV
ncbi:uncharacterized protein LOC143291544 [Babylonia areolata]|uniref:uncharacterized protein LOC143291544 n=1 Tax=Babylonia areolata TaxID=304850 RepID=UPI003FCF4A5D